jgi:hypothetical protein
MKLLNLGFAKLAYLIQSPAASPKERSSRGLAQFNRQVTFRLIMLLNGHSDFSLCGTVYSVLSIHDLSVCYPSKRLAAG